MLGSEGTGNPYFRWTCDSVVRLMSEYRPYLENYTVDASIFVVKLLSADGECLGTRNRRRTYEAAKSLGELPTEH